MPTLAPILTCDPPISNGWRKTSIAPLAMAPACCFDSMPGMIDQRTRRRRRGRAGFFRSCRCPWLRGNIRVSALRHLAKQLIAHIVAEGVVDRLEAVEVDEQQRSELFASFDRSRRVDLDLFAVRQFGDRVVEGERADLAHAGAQIRKHSLEGERQAADLADAFHAERRIDVARRRPRAPPPKDRTSRWSCGAPMISSDDDSAASVSAGRGQELPHQRLRLLRADAEHLVLRRLHRPRRPRMCRPSTIFS